MMAERTDGRTNERTDGNNITAYTVLAWNVLRDQIGNR